MKKRIFAILSVIMALIIGVSISGGCNLVTTNNERDLEQVVATVQIDESAEKEEIKKKEMVMAYLNYGYYQYQGSSQEVVFTNILNDLVNTRILVQNAMLSFDKGEAPFNTIVKNANISDKFDPARYLTEEDVKEIEYNVKKAMNDFIASYEEVEEAGVSDTLTTTARTAPKNAKNDDSVTEEYKLNYKIDSGENNPKRRTAYLKVIEMLDTNGLLGEYSGDITTTTYYKNNVKNQQESKLIEKYEECIKNAERRKITFQVLETNYAEMYNKQKDKYTASASDFSSALSGASASNPVVYSPYSGYGYVYNLLLGASDTQTALIENLEGSQDEKNLARKQILEGITVKDLRSSWVLSGYDFDVATKKFTGDYALTENSLAFNGAVEVVKEANKEKGENAEYRVHPTEMNVNDFVKFMEEYVYGAEQTAVADSNVNIKKKCDIATATDDYNERVQELIFAYSTDPGSLDSYKGYVISPIPAPGASETYVQEFADAGRELLTMGGKSYIMVATDYGYHVMFYSEALGADAGYATLKDYLNSLDATMGGKASWEEYYNDMMANWNDEDADSEFYLYQLQKLYSEKMETTKLSEIENEVLNRYKSDSSKVVIYKDRYQNLISGN